jgi:hypothetical protein
VPKSKTKTGEHLFTAKQVAQNCPAKLENLAKQAIECLAKAKEREEAADEIVSEAFAKAEPHYDEARDHQKKAGEYLVEAYKACSEDGFKVFREKFFPHLQRSRVYQLMQIAVGTYTLDEIREATRNRVAKHRANKKAEAAVPTPSVTPQPVTDEAVPPAAGHVEPVSEAPAEQAQARSPLKVVDTALIDFNSLVGRLLQIAKQEPGRFAKTDHPAEALAKLGIFFTELAKLKQSHAAVGLKEVA